MLARRGRLERVGGASTASRLGPSASCSNTTKRFCGRRPGATSHTPVVSHDSALELYGLTDLNPAIIHVTIPRYT